MTLAALVSGAERLGVRLTPRQLEQFEALRDELLAWNERHNLTSIRDPAEVERLHFLDSLTLLAAMRPAGPTRAAAGQRAAAAPESLIDVGAGAGFPGLALKIVVPSLHVTLVESVGKKSAFMEHAIDVLGLRDAWVVTARAEELGQDRRTREWFDWSVARAVSSLAVLAEYLLPLTRVGGAMLAPKKGDIAEELHAAATAFRLLGGAPAETVPVSLPGLEDDRLIVRVRKVRPTPSGYPRRVGLPAKSPIGTAPPAPRADRL